MPWEALKFYNHTGPGRRKAMEEEEMEELARKLLTEYYTWFDDDFTLDPNEPLGINVKKFPMKGMGWDISFRPTSYAAPLTESLKQSLSSKSGVLISDEVPEQTKKDILESKINSTKRHKFKPEFFEKPKGDPASASKRWSYEKDEYVEEDRSYAGISTASTYKVSGSNLTKEEVRVWRGRTSIRPSFSPPRFLRNVLRRYVILIRRFAPRLGLRSWSRSGTPTMPGGRSRLRLFRRSPDNPRPPPSPFLPLGRSRGSSSSREKY